MGKKSRKKRYTDNNVKKPVEPEISPEVEKIFKIIVKTMSWVVGICFLLIIILPNFEFYLLDEIVKFIFFLGVFNLFLFVLLEFFGNSIKKIINKRYL